VPSPTKPELDDKANHSMNQNRQSNAPRYQFSGQIDRCCDKPQRIKAAATTLRTLSNEYRLVMLLLLTEKEQSVGEIRNRVGLSHSGCSQHLAILERRGFVHKRRDRRRRYYSLATRTALPLLKALGQLAPPAAANQRSRNAPN
jgi:DNA-binding transcriptional ArsR family regulator